MVVLFNNRYKMAGYASIGSVIVYQARPLSGGKDWSFGGISSTRELQVRVEVV